MIILKSAQEIDKMRAAGRAAAQVRDALAASVKAGMKTRELDRLTAELIRKQNAKPAFLGYHGYPSYVCVSVNEEVVHGIPGDRVIREGDLVSIDVGLFIDGYCGDTAVTIAVGETTADRRRLMETTKKSLLAGIEKARPGNRLGDISHAVQSVVESEGFSVVRDFVGHGIGREMHEEPQVPNFGQAGKGPKLKAGMVFAIEPMVNLGDYKVKVLDDGWTVVTEDGLPSAHFEHTVAILENGPEILTKV